MQINNKKNSNHTDAVDLYQHFINILRANQAELRINGKSIVYGNVMLIDDLNAKKGRVLIGNFKYHVTGKQLILQ